MSPELVATYRLQLRPGFGFVEARDLVPYLARLGISHVYTSPYLQAASGSTHGYDVVDPTRVNVELGGPAARDLLVKELEQHGMGHVIDLVPNHMAIVGRENPWWWDVLENGPSSRFASYFDVDWEASDERWSNKVLLPVLGDHYGRVLEAGELSPVHEDGLVTVRYWEHVFPVDPSTLAPLLARAADVAGSQMLEVVASGCVHLPRPGIHQPAQADRRHREKTDLGNLLRRVVADEPAARAAIDREVEALGADIDRLDALLEEQNYRLAFWRAAARDLGYRRFFDIHDLAGLRVEDPEVFDASHALPLSWVREGSVQGLRIDHPDGLRDPAGYFRRLRDAAPEAWIVAEKILEPGEALREDWPIDGTTGYDFLAAAGGLFVHGDGLGPLGHICAEFTGREETSAGLVEASKRQVLRELLASEINSLTELFVTVCERHRRYRDYGRGELADALREVAVAFPVYRTYVSAARRAICDEDVAAVEAAIAGAKAARDDLDPDLLHFLRDLLLLRIEGELEGELAMRFQQLTGPAMAKGVEDTTFYRDLRLVAMNEVGGNPAHGTTSVEEFHDHCRRAADRWPRGMLTTSTHDTKRSEDVRTRLSLLSEMPDTWARAVRSWTRLLEPYRDERVDRAAEYLFYQTVVGAWPITAERVTAYLEKAGREAKLRTSWREPDEAYESAVRDFAEAALADEDFCAGVADFCTVLQRPGRVNGLALTLLKLTAPGVPDVYQGTELWDHSLVDPDNRRPVDFEARASLLAASRELSCDEVLERAAEGLPKLWLMQRALAVRHAHAAAFGPQGTYTPLAVTSQHADHVVAFARGDEVVTVVPRLMLRLEGGWHDTAVTLPDGSWRNALTGEDVGGNPAPVGELLARFPVALLVRQKET
ncbi:malto-oligosyltrehalose synthase [bacterium]|nr:malto-oligosyltrehalose synthase [bacterium]